MKKHLNGEDIEMTAAEVSQREADIAECKTRDTAEANAKTKSANQFY